MANSAATWLTDSNERLVAKAAGQAGLALLPGTRFALEGPAPQAFRLGYAALDEGQIARAVEILARSVPG